MKPSTDRASRFRAVLMCYASDMDDAKAARETVAVLKQADLATLDVSVYSTLNERPAEGHDIADQKTHRCSALEGNSVIVAQMTPFLDE